MSEINLKEKLVEISHQVEPVIERLLTDDVEPLNQEVAYHQCKSGGKRIRPALVITAGRVFDAETESLLEVAAATEILHNSTLIIDDIIDHSEFRRNEPTTWSKYGQSIAECASFMYMASIFSALSRTNNSRKISDLFGKTLKTIIDGEIKDILFERSGRDNEPFVVEHRYQNITTDDYFKMIGQKTAVLLECCCRAGALTAGVDDERADIIGDFGYNLGMAFQVRDDILDIFGDEKEFGKKLGQDIIDKQMGNIIILSAIEKLNSEDSAIIRNLLNGPDEVTESDVQTVTELINKTDAKTSAEQLANDFIQKSYDDLSKLPQNEHTDLLMEIAKYIVDRQV